MARDGNLASVAKVNYYQSEMGREYIEVKHFPKKAIQALKDVSKVD